jgi:alpha-beta hydrolase superfamily lysophospholipase
MKSFESKFDGADAASFYVRGWEPDSGQPKAVIALVHGLGEHVGRYDHAGKALTQAGYALAGFDLRGHGKSGGTRGHIASLDAVLRDIRQFVEFQKHKFPGVPIFIYGHSLGGLLTLAYAIQHGEDIHGAIVTGAALRSPILEQKAKVLLVKLLGSLLPGMIIPTGLDPNTISRDPGVVQKYIADPLVHDKTSLGLARTGFSAIDFCFTHANEIKPPLLIMHGKADMGTYPSGSEDFAKLASEKNPDVTLKIWDGLYHEIHNEPEQADVFKMIIEWLDKHTTAR